MKFIDYILKFGFGIALGLVIIFKISPLLFNKAVELKKEVLQEDELLFLSLECFIPNDYEDIKLTGELSNSKKFITIYEVTNDATYNSFIDLMISNGVIDNKELNGKLPFTLTKKQLNNLGEVRVKVNINSQKIEKLTINNQYIIGEEPSIIRIGFIYFLAVLTFMLGLASLLITIFMFINSYGIYSKTGSLPKLPNTVESKIKGLKFIASMFKRK